MSDRRKTATEASILADQELHATIHRKLQEATSQPPGGRVWDLAIKVASRCPRCVGMAADLGMSVGEWQRKLLENARERT
jgi:hypothetical protein